METGIFCLPLVAGTGKTGAISLTFSLDVSAPNHKIGGVARAFQQTPYPIDIHFEINGDFTRITLMPQNTHILVVLEGNNLLKGRIVLEPSWQTGSGTFSFADETGKQYTLENVPVKLSQNGKPQDTKLN